MAMHSGPKEWDRMLDGGIALEQSTAWYGTVLDSPELIFGLKLSMCVACILLLEINNMNYV